MADWVGGWTCCVEQGHYGHRARKATWLYANGVELQTLIWGKAEGKEHLDDGHHAKPGTERAPRARVRGLAVARTPIAFRDVLLEMARTVNYPIGL